MPNAEPSRHLVSTSRSTPNRIGNEHRPRVFTRRLGPGPTALIERCYSVFTDPTLRALFALSERDSLSFIGTLQRSTCPFVRGAVSVPRHWGIGNRKQCGVTREHRAAGSRRSDRIHKRRKNRMKRSAINSADLRLEVPAGWGVTPARQPVSFAREGEFSTFAFKVSPKGMREGRYDIKAVATYEGREYGEGFTVVARQDLGRRREAHHAAASGGIG